MAEPVTVMCPECGYLIEVKDIQTLLLSIHQANDCSVVAPLVSHPPHE